MKLILLLLSALSLSPAARAEITYKQYVDLLALKEAGRAKHGYGALLLDHWLDGMASGLSYAYVVNRDSSPKAYCLPENLALSGDVLGSAIKQLLDEIPSLKKNENSMGAIAVAATKRAFPCK